MKRSYLYLLIILLAGFRQVHAITEQSTSFAAFLREGGQFQRSGYYLDAQTAYRTALLQAEQQNNVKAQALAKSALGYIAYLLHHPEQAEPLLTQALALAKTNHQADVIMITYYYSGLTAQSLNRAQQAQTNLQEALTGAIQASNHELAARCHLALALIAQNQTDFKEYQQLALANIEQITQSAIAGKLRLMLVEQWLNNPFLSTLIAQNSS